MNILMLCSKYSFSDNDPWLTNELADSLVAQGNLVRVVVLDWSGGVVEPMRHISTTGISVLFLPPLQVIGVGRFLRNLAKWLFSARVVARLVAAELQEEQFDLVISFSPSVVMRGLLSRCLRQFCCPAYLVQWDFFPFHHQQIGIFSPWLVRFAAWFEEREIRRFTAIGCMSLKNIEYLQGHYHLRPEQNVHLLPIWGRPKVIPYLDRNELRRSNGLPIGRVIAVFGGQLVAGRGIEDLIEVAELARRRDPRLYFLVIGSGPLEADVKKYIGKKGTNLQWFPRIPREDYLQLLSACDIGLVCTVRGVDVPSFPSKTIDFFQASLPIVASVETTTDYSDFLILQGLGLSTEAGVVEAFLGNLQKLADDAGLRQDMGDRGRRYLKDIMNVDRIASIIIRESNLPELGNKS